MVGPYGDSVRFEYSHNPLLHAEIDGVRIITNDATELPCMSAGADRIDIYAWIVSAGCTVGGGVYGVQPGRREMRRAAMLLEGETASAVICCIHASRYEIDTDARRRTYYARPHSAKRTHYKHHSAPHHHHLPFSPSSTLTTTTTTCTLLTPPPSPTPTSSPTPGTARVGSTPHC